MTTTTAPRPGWVPPADLDVLEPTDRLLVLRDRLDRAEAQWEELRARPGELLDERDNLEQRLLDGTATDRTREQLARLTVRIAAAPGEVAAAADEYAAALIAWARFVEPEALEVQQEARREQTRIFGAVRREPGRRPAQQGHATPELRDAAEEAEPFRQRELAADRLKSHARSRVNGLLRVNLRRHGDLQKGRRQFAERARVEAAQEVIAR